MLLSGNGFCQKQNFDVLSFTVPANWQKIQNEGGVQLSASDNKTGGYAVAVITKATSSDAAASENFTTDWTRLVKSTVQVNTEPVMEEPAKENGWTILSGNANYTDGANKGSVTLLTATGGGQMVSVVLMTNTQQYQTELISFVNSLELKKADTPATASDDPSTAGIPGSPALSGLWCDNLLETSGYANGFPQYTAGYFRREYLFNEDGTYVFRIKNWSTLLKEILFIYETGAYTVKGNQITLTPQKGIGEWWSKKDNNTKLWGRRTKAADYKPEKVTYDFEIKYYSGTKDYSLLLNPGRTTERDGTYHQANSFSYSRREKGASLIDNPPGFRTGSENNSKGGPVTSPLSGKIWQGTTTEKFSNAGGTSYNTGGFATNQYSFNADGTYRFLAVTASHFTTTKTLNYETGTYSINGNQLTITPEKGHNEEWSKVGKTSNGNSDAANRAINDTWGKKLQTSARKLEQVTYTFSIGDNGGRPVLILKYSSGRTEREGNGSQTWLNETAAENSVNVPGGLD